MPSSSVLFPILSFTKVKKSWAGMQLLLSCNSLAIHVSKFLTLHSTRNFPFICLFNAIDISGQFHQNSKRKAYTKSAAVVSIIIDIGRCAESDSPGAGSIISPCPDTSCSCNEFCQFKDLTNRCKSVEIGERLTHQRREDENGRQRLTFQRKDRHFST